MGECILNLLPTLRDSGLTIFRVTHDAAIARLADRIVRLKDGRVCSPGCKATFDKAPEKYASK